jgi:capsular exopolysaccharide synthesis family protein
MGIADYLTGIRRHWRVVVAAVGIGVLVAWVTSTVVPAPAPSVSYSATAVLLNTGSFVATPTAGAPSLETVATLATLDPVVERVATSIGYKGDNQTLAESVSAVADPQSPGLLRITATADHDDAAVEVADAFATELIAYLHADRQTKAEESLERVDAQVADVQAEIASIERRLPIASPAQAAILSGRQQGLTNNLSFLSGLYQQYLREVLEPPAFELVERATSVPVSAPGYQPPRSRAARVLFGGIIGLIGGIVIALLLHRFDAKIRTAEVAERALDAPVVAEIPRIPKHDRGGLVIFERPMSAPSEAIRLLGAGLVQGSIAASTNGNRRRSDGRGKVVMVTSAAPGEGKSTLVANLAVALGSAGRSVLVLSCDFRRPTIHTLLEAPNLHGLTDVLASSHDGSILNGCVVRTRFEGVSIAPSGASAASPPGEILATGAMRRAMREARASAEIVLVDTAPMLAASDAAHLVPESDIVLVVVRAGVLTMSLARRTREVLQRLQSPSVGVILNGAEKTAMPPGYREYFRRIPPPEQDPAEWTGDGRERVGDSPTYRVPQGQDKV